MERERADAALAERLSAIEETADEVIGKARARADELLAKTRASADQSRQEPSPRSTDDTRAAEDEAVRAERERADEIVRAQRARQVAPLAAERGETDKDLSGERAQADDAVATRDEFLAIVSHDLRNMLSSMVGFAALIAKAASSQDQAEQVLTYAQRIQRSGARMNRLIGDLLDIASIEAGRLAVACELADPTQVVLEAVDTFQTRAAECGVSLVAEIAASTPLTAYDPSRMLQVLTNLIGNAIKFTPSGGKVVVRLEHAADELCFAVIDSGVGIPSDKLEAVFERFQQVVSNDRRGIGLGLYISKCIVQGHRGRIWAESQVGAGSTFRFTLPEHASEQAPGSASGAADGYAIPKTLAT